MSKLDELLDAYRDVAVARALNEWRVSGQRTIDCITAEDDARRAIVDHVEDLKRAEWTRGNLGE